MTSLYRTIYSLEYDIRDALKLIADEAAVAGKEAGLRRSGKSLAPTFSIVGLKQRRRSSILAVKEAGYDIRDFKRRIQTRLNDLGSSRKSAACVLEQFRTRIDTLTLVRSELSREDHLQSATIALPEHRRAIGKLDAFNPEVLKRVVLSLYRRVRRLANNAKLFGVIEVSIADYDGLWLFEPHIHLIVSGVSLGELRSVMPQGGKSSTVYNLGGFLLYLTKFKAERRSGYVDHRGNQGRRRNPMTSREHGEWAIWNAKFRPTELIVMKGFGRLFDQEFRSADLRETITRLVKRRRR